MNHRLLISLGLLLAAAFGAPNQALAQKGKPPDVPGVAQFRCPSGSDCMQPPADGIQAASALIGQGSAAETGQGAFLNVSNGELWIGFGESVYSLDMYFTQRQGAAPCAATGSCRLISSTVQVFAADGEFQSNVLGPDDGDEPVANGLLAVPVGHTWRSRLKVSFFDRGLLWGLNFNTIDYADASNINVTRTGACTWVFEPGQGDVGGLSAWGNSAKGKRVRTDEGLYIMPFKITFSVESC